MCWAVSFISIWIIYMCRISTSSSVTRRSKNHRATFRNQHKEQCSIQCVANDTKPDHTTIDPHRRTSNPKSSQITAKKRNSTHAPGTYTGMHLHAAGHQEAGHPAPALTHRHTPRPGVHETRREHSIDRGVRRRHISTSDSK